MDVEKLLDLLLECGQKPEQAAQVKEDLVIPLVSVIRDFSGELRPALEDLLNFVIDRKIEAYRKYTEAGIAPELAVSLINSDSIMAMKNLKK